MRNVKLPGAINDVGSKQGFEGVSVLYNREVASINGEDVEVPVCKVAYQLTPDEVAALVEGGRLVLTILCQRVPPHRVEVQPV